MKEVFCWGHLRRVVLLDVWQTGYVERMFFASRASSSELAKWCRRMGTSLGAGLDMRQICERESGRGSRGMRRHMQAIGQAVKTGDSLADAMKRADGYFPSLLCEMVEVGEHSGRLERALFRMADQYDHQQKVRQKFVAAVTWPATQLVLAILVVGGLIWLVGLIGEMRGEKPIDMLGLGLVGNRGLAIYSGIVLSCAASAVALYFFAATNPLVARLAAHVPVLGHCLQAMALARLSWTLSMSHDAGVDARKSVAAALRGGNFYSFSRHQLQIDKSIAQGQEIHEALRATGEFPPDFLDALENGEMSGQLSEVLLRQADEYQERANSYSLRLAGIAAFLVWMGVATLIVFMIFRLYSFYINALNEALKF